MPPVTHLRWRFQGFREVFPSLFRPFSNDFNPFQGILRLNASKSRPHLGLEALGYAPRLLEGLLLSFSLPGLEAAAAARAAARLGAECTEELSQQHTHLVAAEARGAPETWGNHAKMNYNDGFQWFSMVFHTFFMVSPMFFRVPW